MAFSLNTRKVGEVILIDMSGRLSIGEAVLLLRTTIRRFVEDGTLKFVLNLGNVSHIDSAGLGEIVRTYTTVSRQGGSLKLLSLTKRITDLLSITKLLTVFETYDNEADAVRSFTSSANV